MASGVLRRAWQLWMELAGYIGDFQARLVLTLFYFTIVPPFALLARFGVDPLRLRRRQVATAWSPRRALKADLASGRRQA